MKHKISIPIGIAAIAVIFALGFIVSNQLTFAANLCGSGFCEPNSGISYPSPLSQFFGGDVLHHHWHGGFGSHFHGGFHHRH
ncbi:MAG: hypothetical protein WA364_14125 [Candidatus Nitrosopolaris sp.]